MATCPACSADNPELSKFCSECGGALGPEIASTLPPRDRRVSAESSVLPPSADRSDHGRFLPGTKLANRYRIVSLVGTGGMGEVYRADDLKLGHTVALKFLPKDFSEDAQRLEYFHSEVRLTRQISHPNVCRVYDIGEADGQYFLSMEYIDGEDLKGLLRRIGRLPSDKGVEIAQQLCAGLAAAHDKGVVHRDLKPANIMIDGRGQVRITDFGLAKLAADDGEAEPAGTPAYMAPEQLARGETTIQSDLYSLGLIFYELFTGKAVHTTSSIPELLRVHEESSLVQPSSLVDNMDPAVERAILRCLEKVPHERPSSAAAVAASLPGGDPLAAVLAAGETPSPELVAAAGKSVAVSPAIGATYLTGIVILLFAASLLADRVRLVNRSPLERSADSLQDEAREILSDLGFNESIDSSAGGFSISDTDLDAVRKAELSLGLSDRWALLETGPWPGWRFWYRQSPTQLVASDFWETPGRLSHTRVTPKSPGWNVPGMAGVELSPRGELRRFQVIADWTSPENSTHTQVGIETWRAWFPERMIGFDLADLSTTTISSVSWIPRVAYDQAQCWEGQWPDSTQALYVVAAAYAGRPVHFEIHSPHAPTYETAGSAQTGQDLLIFIIIGVQVPAVALAWWNLRLGRGDRRGAFRLAFFVFVASMLTWVFGASHTTGLAEAGIFYIGVAQGLFQSGLSWILYIALEPFVRRFWPETLISWTRVLDGRWSDPRVGRDLLAGVFVATMGTVLFQCGVFTSTLLGLETALEWSPPRSLWGPMDLVAEALQLPFNGIVLALTILTLLVLLRIAFRSERWAAIVAVLVFAAVYYLMMPGHKYVAWLPAGLYIGAVILLLTRFGLFAVVTTFVAVELLKFPITTNSSAFYFDNGLFAIGVVLALAVYGLYRSLGNRMLVSALQTATGQR